MFTLFPSMMATSFPDSSKPDQIVIETMVTVVTNRILATNVPRSQSLQLPSSLLTPHHHAYYQHRLSEHIGHLKLIDDLLNKRGPWHREQCCWWHGPATLASSPTANRVCGFFHRSARPRVREVDVSYNRNISRSEFFAPRIPTMPCYQQRIADARALPSSKTMGRYFSCSFFCAFRRDDKVAC